MTIIKNYTKSNLTNYSAPSWVPVGFEKQSYAITLDSLYSQVGIRTLYAFGTSYARAVLNTLQWLILQIYEIKWRWGTNKSKKVSNMTKKEVVRFFLLAAISSGHLLGPSSIPKRATSKISNYRRWQKFLPNFLTKSFLNVDSIYNLDEILTKSRNFFE